MTNALFAEQPNNIIDFPTQSKSNEWYTPARYIEAARATMGGIDLDPASCELANRTVKVARYYTKEQNGLAQEWYGRVWLNPPYSSDKSPTGMSGGKQQGPTALFVAKLIDAYSTGDVEQAIVCVNADMVRSWFQPLWDYVLCFSSHPIQFLRPSLKSEHHFFPTCFAYLGPHEQAFIDHFSPFGRIAKAIDSPRRAVAQPSLWEVR